MEEPLTEAGREEPSYQERVLAHLRATLTVPARAAAPPLMEEPREQEAGCLRRYGILAVPTTAAPPPAWHAWLQRLTETAQGMDPGMHMEAPDEGVQRTITATPEEQLHLLEELQRLLHGTMEEQYARSKSPPGTMDP